MNLGPASLFLGRLVGSTVVTPQTEAHSGAGPWGSGNVGSGIAFVLLMEDPF